MGQNPVLSAKIHCNFDFRVREKVYAKAEASIRINARTLLFDDEMQRLENVGYFLFWNSWIL